ncbi:GNAT family N-acetyltransferase [Haladaptatus sp. SPP-AMP-3]|uniref:GNAT family N-acetyltransferase n=1 Tax=Haladaptatus sp. SPP-AMP-3 TaxID=3121295 RepID=UPI003C2F0B15
MMWEDVDLERSMFWGARRGDDITGVVRLELDLPHALLGSLYVELEYREQGLGRRLVRYIETEAMDRDVERLFLFSTEAGGFFQELSYDEVAVDETVDAVPEVPQVEWYRNHPNLLQQEVTFVKEFATQR